MKTAVIAGATGLTGKSLLYQLLTNKEYTHIFILVRKELAIKDPKLTQLIFNYDNPADYQNIPLADELFCCLGTTIAKAGSQEAFTKVDFEYPAKLAEAASSKGYSKYLIVTALGANQKSRFFYNRVKGDIEGKLRDLKFDSIYLCRPSLILGQRPEARLGEEIGRFFAKFISVFLFGSLYKYRGIEASVLAKAMIVLAAENSAGVHIVESDKLARLGKK